MEVTTITQDSPASKAGLQVGDKIDKVNKQEMEQLSGDEWRELMVTSERITLQVRQRKQVPTNPEQTKKRKKERQHKP